MIYLVLFLILILFILWCMLKISSISDEFIEKTIDDNIECFNSKEKID